MNWKKIDGLEYFVSDTGLVKNKSGKILKPDLSFGYHRVCLTKDKVHKRYSIHRLVAMAFIPNTENKPHINHINAIRNDNKVENLEWCTPSENGKHTVKLGRHKKQNGELNTSSKLKEKQVIEIKKLLKDGVSQYRIAKNYGVNKVTIFDIKHNKTWTHLQMA